MRLKSKNDAILLVVTVINANALLQQECKCVPVMCGAEHWNRALKIEPEFPEFSFCFGFSQLWPVTNHGSHPEREVKQGMTERRFLRSSLAVTCCHLWPFTVIVTTGNSWAIPGKTQGLSYLLYLDDIHEISVKYVLFHLCLVGEWNKNTCRRET